MPLYERQSDRKSQSEAVQALENHFNTLGQHYRLKETRQEDALSHDFTIDFNGEALGVGEIKCRDYPLSFFKDRGWLVEVERIENLDKAHGHPVIMAAKTSDNRVFYGLARDMLQANHEKAPASWMKDDHGTKPCSKSGIIVPISEVTVVPFRRP